MLFNSYVFMLAFLPLTLLGYFLLGRLPEKNQLNKVFLVLASFLFYGYNNPGYVPIIAGSILVNYALSQLMLTREKKAVRLPLMLLGLFLNLGVLFYFKYHDFFFEATPDFIQFEDLQSAARFAVVTVFAQRLPVVFIPEKIAISAMRHDVVYHGRRGQMAVFLAFRAQGMLGQKSLSCLSPAGVVSSGSCAAAKGVVTPFLAMPLAVDAAVAEVGTARIAAGAFGRMRHIDLLFRQ